MSRNEKYEELANQIPELVGGKENISFFTHCVTRLRFNLKDKSLVKIKEIEKLPGVVGAKWSGEQLQVIIGQSVADAYKLICEKTGIKQEDAVSENLDKGPRKISLSGILDGIAGCVTPLIPALIGAGMIKVVILLAELTNLLTADMPTHIVLSFAADAVFYYLPILVGATAAKKFNTNVGLGMVLGAMLLHPNFLAAVNDGVSLSVFGIPVYGASYANMIFPTILAVFTMSFVERFFAKYSPDAIRSIIVPLCTLLIMIPLTLCLLAPLGSFIGNYITDGVLWLYNNVGFLGVALLGGLWPVLVLTGMHTTFAPYLVQSISVSGFDPIVCTASFLSNFSQGAASAAVAIKAKDVNVKTNASSCAITAIFGGVSEPALFGITLKYKTPLYAAMIGGFAGGAIAGLFKVYIYAFAGSGGLFGLPAFIGPDGMNIVYMIISVIAAMLVTFIVTLIIFKNEDIK